MRATPLAVLAMAMPRQGTFPQGGGVRKPQPDPRLARPPSAGGAVNGSKDLGASTSASSTTSRPRALTDGYVLYDSKDLTTHAVCVGMTGSGKTGLCLGAARRGRASTAFRRSSSTQGGPRQPAADVPRAARPRTSRRGSTRTTRAQGASRSTTSPKTQAELLEEGPGRLGPGRRAHPAAARRRRVRDLHARAATPACPSRCSARSRRRPTARDDASACASASDRRIATGLLALLGIDADPLKSREHILLSTHPRRAPGRTARASICAR